MSTARARPAVRPLATLYLALTATALNASAPALSRPRGMEDVFARDARPFLEQHCFSCHGADRAESGLDLQRFTSDEEALRDPELWDYALERVLDGDMPPPGSVAPGEEEVDRFAGWAEGLLEEHARQQGPPVRDPGRVALRRLSHVEYRNAVHDLLGVDFPADELFPADGVAHGFRTASEALPLTELLFERYVEAAEQLAEEAVQIDVPARRTRLGAAALEGGADFAEGKVLARTGDVSAVVELPRRGVYVLRTRVTAQQAGDELARVELRVDDHLLGSFDVASEPGRSELHEVRALLDGGPRRVAAAFPNDHFDPENEDPRRRDRNLWVGWVEVEGPLDAPSPTSFQQELDARFPPSLGPERLGVVLEDLAHRIWRGPVPPEALRRLESFATAGEHRGFDHELQRALTYLFSSPRFVLRVEGEEAGPITAHELATRLALLVWSTTPDDELLALADDGSLLEEPVLRAQLTRLLEDPRSSRMVEAFATGWLQLESLTERQLDPVRFPGYAELRPSMLRETQLVLEHQLRGDGNLWDLLDGSETFVDERLARHYGLDGVEGPAFRAVSLEGTPRRGLLGQASILALTSDPGRTSPVKRGKWVLDVLLGAPPPAPPPGVGELDDAAGELAAASMREQLELHRADPACSACHQRMDPLGFGLENFAADGAWRDASGEHTIDASGALPDGRSFDGPLELVAMLRRDDAFLRSLATRVFTFAIGREPGRGDRAWIQELLDGLDPEHPTLRQLLVGVVVSPPFRERGRASGPRPIEAGFKDGAGGGAREGAADGAADGGERGEAQDARLGGPAPGKEPPR